jgi:hypothetical protein
MTSGTTVLLFADTISKDGGNNVMQSHIVPYFFQDSFACKRHSSTLSQALTDTSMSLTSNCGLNLGIVQKINCTGKLHLQN